MELVIPPVTGPNHPEYFLFWGFVFEELKNGVSSITQHKLFCLQFMEDRLLIPHFLLCVTVSFFTIIEPP
jgi:hypothetical protein